MYQCISGGRSAGDSVAGGEGRGGSEAGSQEHCLPQSHLLYASLRSENLNQHSQQRNNDGTENIASPFFQIVPSDKQNFNTEKSIKVLHWAMHQPEVHTHT